MIRQETGEATALLLQRVLICPSRDEISIEEIKNMVTPVIEHQNGSGDYRPMHLRECGEDREVVLYADAGIAVIDQPNDSLKAVYVANGLFQKTVENMNRLRSRGTIDFEGTLRIQLLKEQVVAQNDERTG